jgi:phosphohistidine phosphatase
LKTLYLLRHAKSSWKDSSLDDFDRPINKRGRDAAEKMARYFLQQHIEPGQILCSSAQRTRETLERMFKVLQAPIPTRFEKGIYLAEAPALLRRLQRLSDSLSAVLVIGHNPGLERLALMLAGGGESETRGQLAEKFPTAGLAVLVADLEHWSDLEPECARLESFVRPRDLDAE